MYFFNNTAIYNLIVTTSGLKWIKYQMYKDIE